MLKRRINEIWINNYNPEWIRAWNGNMDIQICTDIFAIITYISDYCSKTETTKMSELLKAMRGNNSLNLKQRLETLKDILLTHRKMGICEAIYKLMPNLHLKDSNIKCSFVSSGFPENRSKFLVKLPPETENIPEENIIKIPTTQNKYIAPISIQDYYKNRPAELEEMCLAQFITQYQKTEKTKAIEKALLENKRGHFGLFISPDIKLPHAITIFVTTHSTDTVRYFQQRQFPQVIRIHKYKEKNDFHQFCYSELMLFYPWRNETEEFFYNDPISCKEYYSRQSTQETIQCNKKGIYPFKQTLLDAEEILEMYREHELINNPIGDTLDAEGEKDNLESKYSKLYLLLQSLNTISLLVVYCNEH